VDGWTSGSSVGKRIYTRLSSFLEAEEYTEKGLVLGLGGPVVDGKDIVGMDVKAEDLDIAEGAPMKPSNSSEARSA
jgi:hypothetical protein